MQVFAITLYLYVFTLFLFCFLFVGFRLIFVLSSIYANIEIMRNNNKELKAEFNLQMQQNSD